MTGKMIAKEKITANHVCQECGSQWYYGTLFVTDDRTMCDICLSRFAAETPDINLSEVIQ